MHASSKGACSRHHITQWATASTEQRRWSAQAAAARARAGAPRGRPATQRPGQGGARGRRDARDDGGQHVREAEAGLRRRAQAAVRRDVEHLRAAPRAWVSTSIKSSGPAIRSGCSSRSRQPWPQHRYRPVLQRGPRITCCICSATRSGSADGRSTLLSTGTMARPCSNACERRDPSACQAPRRSSGSFFLLHTGTMARSCSNACLSDDTSTSSMHHVSAQKRPLLMLL